MTEATAETSVNAMVLPSAVFEKSPESKVVILVIITIFAISDSHWKITFPAIYFLLSPTVAISLLFIIIFYTRSSNNDLDGIIVATLVAEGVGLILHISMNCQVVYKNNLLFRNIIFLLKKIFRIVLSSFFVYILYNILSLNLILSKVLVDTILMLLITYLFTSVSKT